MTSVISQYTQWPNKSENTQRFVNFKTRAVTLLNSVAKLSEKERKVSNKTFAVYAMSCKHDFIKLNQIKSNLFFSSRK